MKKASLLITIIIISFVTQANDIKTFMGFQLGRKVTNIELTIRAKKINSWTEANTYYIERPVSEFRKFKNCRIRIDKKQRIREIKSTYSSKSKIEIDNEFEIIKGVYQKKYKTIKTIGNRIEIEGNRKYITITKLPDCIEIKYSDFTEYDKSAPTIKTKNKQEIQKEITEQETTNI